MQSQGLTLQEDMFTTGDNPHGCGHATRTVYKGDRTTAANYLLNKGSNLAIRTETIVDKVILEGSGSNLRATAVKVLDKDGKEQEIKARKEIIVSGGAYCSPTHSPPLWYRTKTRASKSWDRLQSRPSGCGKESHGPSRKSP